MLRYLLLLALIYVSRIGTFAQGISVQEDPAVQDIMESYEEVNKGKPYVQGWRVQILSTVDRQEFESVRATFKSRFPYIQTSWVHNRPYYKLRAGAYAKKLEALRLQHLLRTYYPSAYPAVDNEIRPEEIIGNLEGQDNR